jgi:hypothetical protein
MKITEELNETTYLDRLYIRVDNTKIIELDSITDSTHRPLDNTFTSLIHCSLLRDSDDRYLIMNRGDEYLLEFRIPSSYHALQFVAEGYYREH